MLGHFAGSHSTSKLLNTQPHTMETCNGALSGGFFSNLVSKEIYVIHNAILRKV